MDFNHIEYKKPFYAVSEPLHAHLTEYSRAANLPVHYEDLMRFRDLLPIRDEHGEDTLWFSAVYDPVDNEHLRNELTRIYELLMAEGATFPHLTIASIDFCSFGNSKPFRVKVLNAINDNHDYFYVKRADASRLYGLELEELLSPDKMSFLVSGDTLIEQHIVGLPCDAFLLKNAAVKIENRTRLAKEFVKFNERCFTRLLGDMRAYNYVVVITQDFDNVQYRLRAIDFDQQSYEGRMRIYLPQFFKDNLELVQLAIELLPEATAEQYKQEERGAMRKRLRAVLPRAQSLLSSMAHDTLSTPENRQRLGQDLNQEHQTDAFTGLDSMGAILIKHLEFHLQVEVFERR